MSFTDNNTRGSRFGEFRKKLSRTFYEFSLFERFLVFFFFVLFACSLFSILVKANQRFMVEVPHEGGELKEAMIGSPRFINPVLAISDTDRDLTALVYSGLLRLNASGELIPDLAESYSVSDDGLTYYFKIKENAQFQDGTPVTVDDVIFTILKTQDPAIKSPKRPNWDGVHIEKINDKELNFTLNAPYAPFIYNATLGILPKHKWEKITAEEFPFSSLNTNAVGSGPYEIRSIQKDADEIITSYSLKAFSDYAIKKPYISKISVLFFDTEEEEIAAFNKKQVTSLHSLTPKNIPRLNAETSQTISLPFSRIFALFFNQNKWGTLANKNIREALDYATDRDDIVNSILSGYATPLVSPLTVFSTQSSTTTHGFNLDVAKAKIQAAGYTFDDQGLAVKGEGDAAEKISFTLSTNNVPELMLVGQKLVDNYRAIGINAELKSYDTNQFTTDVIRPREYQAILFGNVINRDLDYYAFWHSSQRSDPGLNLSAYTSINGDRALEQARSSISQEEKISYLQKFEKEVINDVPAVFLYSPDFIYVVPQTVRAQFPQIIVTPSDRFAEVYNWHLETDMVWKIFAR